MEILSVKDNPAFVNMPQERLHDSWITNSRQVVNDGAEAMDSFWFSGLQQSAR